MFSWALYKQSWKANWITWLAIALVNCFILVIIMLMAGGEGLGSITKAVTETFVKDELEANYKNSAINYHYVSNDSLENFDKAFLDQYINEIKSNPYQAPTEVNIANAYSYAVNQYITEVDRKIKNIDSSYVEDSAPYEELMGAAMFALNPNGMMSAIYEKYEVGSTPSEYDIMSLILSIDANEMMQLWMGADTLDDLYDVTTSLTRINYRFQRSRYASVIFLAGNMTSSEAKQEILKSLEKVKITEDIYDTFGFDYAGLKSLSNEAILTYQAILDFEISKIDKDDYSSEEEYLRKIDEARALVQDDITLTLITILPEELSESLKEMEDYDVYTMTVGNMYFKIVGLLIAIVYIIVVGINLVVGQVDSGSMAYILATGTKRNAVTITQLIFFVSSTLFLYILSTIVSLISFKISPPPLTDVTVWKLVLFNLGAFSVIIALSGVIFLSSCIFNKSRRAMSLGGGFSVLTLVCTILGMFASDSTPAMMRMEALSIFNNFSIVTLFDLDSIIASTNTYIWKMGILFGSAIICFIVGINVFKKKDLPL